MAVCGFKIMCLFLLLFEFGFCGKTPPSGPFRTAIVSIEDCVNPSKPYVKDPPVVFNGVTRNNTIDGNITFFRDTRYMKVRVKSFIMRNGKWKQVHIFNNIDCHGMVIHVICMMMNVKYDRKNCMYYKGLSNIFSDAMFVFLANSVINYISCTNLTKLRSLFECADLRNYSSNSKDYFGVRLLIYRGLIFFSEYRCEPTSTCLGFYGNLWACPMANRDLYAIWDFLLQRV